MTAICRNKRVIFYIVGAPLLFLCVSLYPQHEEMAKNHSVESDPNILNESAVPQVALSPRTIRTVHVIGNKNVPTETIKRKVPYLEGDIFDPLLASKAIRNLDALNRFSHIDIKARNIDDSHVDLYIMLKEKTKLKEVVLKGNTHLTEKEIKKKRDFTEIPAIEEEELTSIAREIKKLYAEKNYLNVEVKPELTVENDAAVATFTILEHQKSLVKQVRFKGNQHVSGKQLRSIIFTREDWLLGFMDKSGTYSPDRLEADRHIIEQFYQNRGYLTAKVTDVTVDIDEKTKNIMVTFSIKEGPLYTVKEISVPGNELMSEEALLQGIPIRPGDIYSRERIVDSIKRLEVLWGEFGYINASIEPAIMPDEATNTVSITLYSELGSKVYLNRLNIIGNQKTRDKIIRRRIGLEEGNLVTTRGMDDSKSRVENLGYFDTRDGVNWKIKRISENLIDLDLMLKEIKTGHANLKLGYGGSADITSPANSFSVGAEIADTNLLGSGISFSLNANFSKDERNFFFNITQPWLMDKPITTAIDIYHRRPTYEDFNNIGPVNEILTGGSLTFGVVTPLLYDTQVLARFGVDSLGYDKKPQVDNNVAIADPVAALQYQRVLDELFTTGEFFWLAQNFSQDLRNNPMHPSRGYKWNATMRFGLPTSASCCVGFYRLEADANWFTPLINEYDLVFRLHGFMGWAGRLRNNFVPYRELFHVGGPASVRGYLFGQIGPKWQDQPTRGADYLGSNKAFWVNAELIFPIKPDMTVKGVAFYDGGAGWDFPYADQLTPGTLINNNFIYRHAVGVGLRMLEPMPLKIDWGFKIDPSKALRETGSEVHLTMSYDW